MRSVFAWYKWRNCSAIGFFSKFTSNNSKTKKAKICFFSAEGQRAQIFLSLHYFSSFSFIGKKKITLKSAHEKGKGNERLRAHATAQREKIESATMPNFVLIKPNETMGADSPTGKVQQNTTRFFLTNAFVSFESRSNAIGAKNYRSSKKKTCARARSETHLRL